MDPAVDMRRRNVCSSLVTAAKRVGAGSRPVRRPHRDCSPRLLGDSIGGRGARCREAHCIITGLGWGALAFVAVVAAVLQLNWFQPIWNAFLIIFVVGHGFELVWAARRHTHALRL